MQLLFQHQLPVIHFLMTHGLPRKFSTFRTALLVAVIPHLLLMGWEKLRPSRFPPRRLLPVAITVTHKEYVIAFFASCVFGHVSVGVREVVRGVSGSYAQSEAINIDAIVIGIAASLTLLWWHQRREHPSTSHYQHSLSQKELNRQQQRLVLSYLLCGIVGYLISVLFSSPTMLAPLFVALTIVTFAFSQTPTTQRLLYAVALFGFLLLFGLDRRLGWLKNSARMVRWGGRLCVVGNVGLAYIVGQIYALNRLNNDGGEEDARRMRTIPNAMLSYNFFLMLAERWLSSLKALEGEVVYGYQSMTFTSFVMAAVGFKLYLKKILPHSYLLAILSISVGKMHPSSPLTTVIFAGAMLSPFAIIKPTTSTGMLGGSSASATLNYAEVDKTVKLYNLLIFPSAIGAYSLLTFFTANNDNGSFDDESFCKYVISVGLAQMVLLYYAGRNHRHRLWRLPKARLPKALVGLGFVSLLSEEFFFNSPTSLAFSLFFNGSVPPVAEIYGFVIVLFGALFSVQRGPLDWRRGESQALGFCAVTGVGAGIMVTRDLVVHIKKVGGMRSYLLMLCTLCATSTVAAFHLYTFIKQSNPMAPRKYTNFLAYALPALNVLVRLFDTKDGSGCTALCFQSMACGGLLAAYVRRREVGFNAVFLSFSSAISMIYKTYGILGGGQGNDIVYSVCLTALATLLFLLVGAEDRARLFDLKTVEGFVSFFHKKKRHSAGSKILHSSDSPRSMKERQRADKDREVRRFVCCVCTIDGLWVMGYGYGYGYEYPSPFHPSPFQLSNQPTTTNGGNNGVRSNLLSRSTTRSSVESPLSSSRLQLSSLPPPFTQFYSAVSPP